MVEKKCSMNTPRCSPVPIYVIKFSRNLEFIQIILLMCSIIKLLYGPVQQPSSSLLTHDAIRKSG